MDLGGGEVQLPAGVDPEAMYSVRFKVQGRDKLGMIRVNGLTTEVDALQMIAAKQSIDCSISYLVNEHEERMSAATLADSGVKPGQLVYVRFGQRTAHLGSAGVVVGADARGEWCSPGHDGIERQGADFPQQPAPSPPMPPPAAYPLSPPPAAYPLSPPPAAYPLSPPLADPLSPVPVSAPVMPGPVQPVPIPRPQSERFSVAMTAAPDFSRHPEYAGLVLPSTHRELQRSGEWQSELGAVQAAVNGEYERRIRCCRPGPLTKRLHVQWLCWNPEEHLAWINPWAHRARMNDGVVDWPDYVTIESNSFAEFHAKLGLLLCQKQSPRWHVGGHLTVILADTPQARAAPWPGSFEAWFRLPARAVPLVSLSTDHNMDVVESAFGDPDYDSLQDQATVQLTALFAPDHRSGLLHSWEHLYLNPEFEPLPEPEPAPPMVPIEPTVVSSPAGLHVQDLGLSPHLESRVSPLNSPDRALPALRELVHDLEAVVQSPDMLAVRSMPLSPAAIRPPVQPMPPHPAELAAVQHAQEMAQAYNEIAQEQLVVHQARHAAVAVERHAYNEALAHPHGLVAAQGPLPGPVAAAHVRAHAVASTNPGFTPRTHAGAAAAAYRHARQMTAAQHAHEQAVHLHARQMGSPPVRSFLG